MLARIRKAVVAGVIAGAGAAISVLAKGGGFDRDTVSQALGAFVAAAAVAVWATWRVPNAPSISR
jgi:hypothetical protein